MNTKATVLLVFLITAVLAGNAMANHFEEFAATADCAGWQVDGTAKIGQAWRPSLDIEFSVTLAQNGQIVDQQTGIVTVRALADADPFSVGGGWAAGLQGVYDVTGTFFLPHTTSGDSIMVFNAVLECGTVDFETKRPRWWYRHPDAWPVNELAVGGQVMSRDCIRQHMMTCYRYGVIKRLFRHTVAAKLNILAGAPNTVQATLDAADAFLASHDRRAHMPRSERRVARELKNLLRDFNRQSSHKSFEEFDKEWDDTNEEDLSWGELKSVFR